MRKSVVVIDSDSSWAYRLCETLSMSDQFIVSPPQQDGKVGLQYIEVNRPEIIIMDLLLPYYDGFYILNYVNNRMAGYDPFIYVVSSTMAQWLQSSSIGFGHFAIKPQMPDAVLHNLNFLLNRESYAVRSFDLDEYITEFVTSFDGGNWYPRDRAAKRAMVVMLNNPAIGSIGKLYEELSQDMNCSPGSCERNLRCYKDAVLSLRTVSYIQKMEADQSEHALNTNAHFYPRMIRVLKRELAALEGSDIKLPINIIRLQ